MAEKIYLENFDDIAGEVYSRSVNEGNDVTVIGDYEFIQFFMQLIMAHDINCEDVGVLNIQYLELSNPEIDGYDGPYLFQVTNIGDVYCEKMVRERDGCTIVTDLEGEDYVYVQDEYADLVKDLDSEDTQVVIIVNEYEEDEVNLKNGFLDVITEGNKITGFSFVREADGIRFCADMHGDVNDTEKFAKLVSHIIYEYNKYMEK